MGIIAAIILVVIIAFFYYKHRKDLILKEFRKRIRNREVGMVCTYKVNQEKRNGTILIGYNGTSDVVPIKTIDGHKITRYVDNIYTA